MDLEVKMYLLIFNGDFPASNVSLLEGNPILRGQQLIMITIRLQVTG